MGLRGLRAKGSRGVAGSGVRGFRVWVEGLGFRGLNIGLWIPPPWAPGRIFEGVASCGRGGREVRGGGVAGLGRRCPPNVLGFRVWALDFRVNPKL